MAKRKMTRSEQCTQNKQVLLRLVRVKNWQMKVKISYVLFLVLFQQVNLLYVFNDGYFWKTAQEAQIERQDQNFSKWEMSI